MLCTCLDETSDLAAEVWTSSVSWISSKSTTSFSGCLLLLGVLVVVVAVGGVLVGCSGCPDQRGNFELYRQTINYFGQEMMVT